MTQGTLRKTSLLTVIVKRKRGLISRRKESREKGEHVLYLYTSVHIYVLNVVVNYLGGGRMWEVSGRVSLRKKQGYIISNKS